MTNCFKFVKFFALLAILFFGFFAVFGCVQELSTPSKQDNQPVSYTETFPDVNRTARMAVSSADLPAVRKDIDLSVLSKPFDPLNVGEMTVELKTRYAINLSSVDNNSQLVVYVTPVPSTAFQQVLSESTNYNYTLEKGKMKFMFPNPAKVIYVDYSALVKVNYGSLNLRDTKAAAIKEFLAPTDLTLNSSDVYKKASTVTLSSGDDVSRSIALTEWIHDNVAYDLKYYAVTLSDVETLKNLAGTCDEFAHLFIGLSKSIGLPARMVGGYTYSGTGWEPHGWAEVYVVGYGWLAVDASFGELGIVDGMHLRETDGVDQNAMQKIRVVATNAVIGSDGVSQAASLKVSELKRFDDLVTLTLDTPKNMRASSTETVKVKVQNNVGRELIVPLQVSLSKGFSKIPTKLVHLGPNESKELTFNVKTPPVQSGFELTSQIIVKSASSKEINEEVHVV